MTETFDLTSIAGFVMSVHSLLCFDRISTLGTAKKALKDRSLKMARMIEVGCTKCGSCGH